MRCPEPSLILTYPMRNLYATAVAELDDDQLLELAGGFSKILANNSKRREGDHESVMQRRGLLEEVQTAWTLHSIYEKRTRARRSPAAEPAKRGYGAAQGKILLFRVQSDS